MNPEWATAAVTLVAFAWAVFLYRQSVKEKRERVPRLVYATPYEMATHVDKGTEYHDPGFRLTDRIVVPEHPEDFDSWFAESGDRRHGERFLKAKQPTWVLPVVVRNHSDEVVSGVRVSPTHTGDSTAYASFEIDYLYPGDVVPCVILLDSTEFLGVHNPAITFTDGGGAEWSRVAAGPVRRRMWRPRLKRW